MGEGWGMTKAMQKTWSLFPISLHLQYAKTLLPLLTLLHVLSLWHTCFFMCDSTYTTWHFVWCYNGVAICVFLLLLMCSWPKLLWLGHHVSIHRETFTCGAKNHPQVPKHFEIHGKTFTVQAKSAKVLALECFVLLEHFVLYSHLLVIMKSSWQNQ